jgi:prolyl-tRNA synthetase
VAPAQAHLVALGDPAAALCLGADLERRGLRVLVDDRKGVSAGVKFADAELLGAPVHVVLGRQLADGYVEVRDRASGERTEVALDEVAEWLVRRLA